MRAPAGNRAWPLDRRCWRVAHVRTRARSAACHRASCHGPRRRSVLRRDIGSRLDLVEVGVLAAACFHRGNSLSTVDARGSLLRDRRHGTIRNEIMKTRGWSPVDGRAVRPPRGSNEYTHGGTGATKT